MAKEAETGSSGSADTVEQKILKALRSGDYTVTYMAPKNITEHTASDGHTFYVIDPWGDSDCGCEIKAAGYTFTGWVSEEGGEWEDVPDDPENAVTVAPVIQSEYAGATPVIIDPIDKPTPTPLPVLSFSFVTYEAASLHLTFEGPSGWTVDDTIADTYRLTNPDPSMDYAATLVVRAVPVNKAYSKSELTREVKGMLDTLASGQMTSFEPSNTAERSFLGTTGVYANYTATDAETGAKVAGRLIVACADKTLYTLHMSCPRGYRDFYVTNVYDKFRHSVKRN